ncbi:hypothetical protein ACFL3I_05865 [Pseudomonadota bacterium]
MIPLFARHLLGVIVKMGGHEVAGVAEDGKQALKLFRSLLDVIDQVLGEAG